MSLSQADIEAIVSDPVLFCSRLSIIDKQGRQRKLHLNSEQIEIIEALKAGDDVLVLKARQIGSSTAVAAYFFWRWYTAPDPETYVVLSHKLASSKHLLKMHKFFYTTQPRTAANPQSKALQRVILVSVKTVNQRITSNSAWNSMPNTPCLRKVRAGIWANNCLPNMTSQKAKAHKATPSA